MFSMLEHCILFPIQSLITRLNSQRLSVVTRAWDAYDLTDNIDKFDCLLFEMFLIGEHKPCLNIQSGSIKAKL